MNHLLNLCNPNPKVFNCSSVFPFLESPASENCTFCVSEDLGLEWEKQEDAMQKLLAADLESSLGPRTDAQTVC